MKSFKEFIAANDNPNSYNKDTDESNHTPGVDRTISTWHNEKVRHSDPRINYIHGSGGCSTSDAYMSYCDHCDKHGKEPVALPSFGKQWMEHSEHQTKKIDGRMKHFVSLSD